MAVLNCLFGCRLNEAVEVEKDIRTILLPSLLEHQQNLQENFINQW